MVQRICDDCGSGIPEGQPWCPRCGIRRRATDSPFDPEPLKWRKPRNSRAWPWERLAPLGITLLLTLCTIVVGFQSRSHSLGRKVTDALTVVFTLPGFGTPHTVHMEAESTETDAGCSFLRGLLGSCVRVHCVVANSGNVAGTAVITATVQNPIQTLTRTRELLLGPGQRERVTFTFGEARAGQRFRANCAASGGGS